MCFDVETATATGRKFLLIDGVRYAPDAQIGDMIETLEAIAKLGGDDVLAQRVDDLLRQLRKNSVEILKALKYGVRLLIKNYDIYDEIGDVIFRGPTKYMDKFLEISQMKSAELRRLRLAQILDDYKETLEEFGFDRDAFTRVTGLDYPDEIERGYGYAPDFNLTDEFIEEYIYLGLRDNANVTIKMSGDYDLDFQRALEEAGIPLSDVPKGKFAPAGFVWHHLDDFDPVTGTCTMQLVRKELHDAVVQAPSYVGALNYGTEHAGACALWKRYFGIVGYNY